MKLEIGETASLNNILYRVEQRLGSGAVSDVYLAELVPIPGSRVVIKLVRDDQVQRLEADKTGQAPLTSGDRQELLRLVEGLRHEAQVLEVLNRSEVSHPGWPETPNPVLRLKWAQETSRERRIVALLDSGDLGPFQPFVVQEMAPPEFRRFDIKGWQDERRLIAVAQAIATVISLAHQHDLALLDFEPRTKGDRIRLQEWDAEGKQPFDLKIIDWNISGGPQDVAQDLFFFGGHLYYFFLGRRLPLDQHKRPPSNLGAKVPNWEEVSEGSRQILQRLLHRDPRQRYQRATQLANDLAWWRKVLDLADAPNVIDLFQDHLWQARREDRYDRVLSVADLALRLDLPSEARRSFEQRLREARDKLEEELWRPISRALATLWTGKAYAKAAGEFQQQLQTLPSEGEQARRACIYYHLALAGDLFKRSRGGQDIRREPAWQALEQASESLIKQAWSQAQDAILEAKRRYPQAAEWRPVNELHNMARAGILWREANELRAKAEPRRADSGRDDWSQIEEGQIALLGEAVAKLEEAKALDPLEPTLAQRLQSGREYLNLRQNLLSRYLNVESLIKQGEEASRAARKAERDKDHDPAEQAYQQATQAFQSAAHDLHAILASDAAQYRAAEWLKQLQPDLQTSQEQQRTMAQLVENHRRFDDIWSQARSSLASGRYTDTVLLFQEAADLFPDRQDVQDQLIIAQAGAQLERLAQGYLETARQHFRLRNLTEAHQTVDQALSFHGQALSTLPGGQNLPQVAGMSLFMLRQGLAQPLRDLSIWIAHVGKEREKVQEVRQIGGRERIEQIVQIIDDLQKYLEERGESLTEEENSWRDQARQWLITWAEARRRLDQVKDDLPQLGTAGIEGSFAHSHQVLDDLTGIPGSAELRARAWRLWLQLVATLPDLGAKKARLEEGRRHPLFEGEDLARAFDVQLTRAEAALRIERDLDLAGEYSWPTWLDEGEGAGRRLQRLALDFDIFPQGAGDIPPISREQITAWHRRREEYLDAYLDDELEKAYTFSLNGQFNQAGNTIRGLIARIPETIRPPSWEQVETFGLALANRERAQKTLDNILNNLQDPASSFQKESEQAATISWPKHPAVPVGQLQALQADLKKAGEMESALHDTPTIEGYADLIYRQLTLARELLEALQHRSDAALNKRMEALRRQLRTAAGTTAERMWQELGNQARTLASNPSGGPLPFLQLYWQARWWRAVAASDPRKREQEKTWLDMAIGTPALAGKLRDRLARLESKGDLDTARKILGIWRRLERDLATNKLATNKADDGTASAAVDLSEATLLATNKADDGTPLVPLPPLPQGAMDDYRPSRQSSSALDRIDDALVYLDEQAQRAASVAESPADLAKTEPEAAAEPAVEPGEPPPQPQPQQEKVSRLGGRLLGRKKAESVAGAAPPARPKPPMRTADDQVVAGSAQADIEEVADRASRLEQHLGSLEKTFQEIGQPLDSQTWQSLRAEAGNIKDLARLLIETDKERRKGQAVRLLNQLAPLQAGADKLDARWAWLVGADQSRLITAVQALKERLDADLQAQVIGIQEQKRTSAARELADLLAQLETEAPSDTSSSLPTLRPQDASLDPESGPDPEDSQTEAIEHAPGISQDASDAARDRLAAAIAAATDAIANEASAAGNRGRALEVWRAVRDATKGKPEWADLHQQAKERLRALRPPPNWKLVAIVGLTALTLLACLASALLITTRCRGDAPAAICGRVPEPVLLALLGPTPTPGPISTPTPTPTITLTPSPSSSPTPTPTPTITPTPTPVAVAPPTDCDIILESAQGGYDVQPLEPVTFQPVQGDVNRFEVVWRLRPAQGGSSCDPERLAELVYQVRLSEDDMKPPFQMAGTDFQPQLLKNGELEAHVSFAVLVLPAGEMTGTETFTLFYLADLERRGEPAAYTRAPSLVLHLPWRLLAPVTPTPTPRPPTATPTPKPSSTPTPTSASLSTPELLEPDDNASVQDTVIFRWRWAGTLTAEQLFEVRVRKKPDLKLEYRGVSARTQEMKTTAGFVALVNDDTTWNNWADGSVTQGAELWWSVAVVQGQDTTVVESGFRKLVFVGRDKLDNGGVTPSPCDCGTINCRLCNCQDHCCQQCCARCK